MIYLKIKAGTFPFCLLFVGLYNSVSIFYSFVCLNPTLSQSMPSGCDDTSASPILLDILTPCYTAIHYFTLEIISYFISHDY